MFQRILKTSRPRFWLYLAGPYLIGLAFLYRQPSFVFEWKYLFIFLFFLFPMNFLLYSVNDFFDQDTDANNPKKSVKESRFDSEYKSIIFLTQSISAVWALIILAWLLPTSVEKLVFVIFLLLSFFYSTPPVAFKRRPFLDSLSNVLYFLPGVLAVYHSPQLSIDVTIIIALTCWTTAMHLFSAIPDIEYDKKAGIRTTAVVLGRSTSLLMCFVLWFCFAGISTSYLLILFPTFIYPVIPFFLLKKKTVSIERVYWYFPYINAGLGFMFFLLAILYV